MHTFLSTQMRLEEEGKHLGRREGVRGFDLLPYLIPTSTAAQRTQARHHSTLDTQHTRHPQHSTPDTHRSALITQAPFRLSLSNQW